MTRQLAVAAFLIAMTAPAASAAPPPKVPAPTYQSVAKEVLIAMDDGVKIAATVTFPSKDGTTPAPGRFPVVLEHDAVRPQRRCAAARRRLFATRGIIGVVADVRGTGGSGGDARGQLLLPARGARRRGPRRVLRHAAVVERARSGWPAAPTSASRSTSPPSSSRRTSRRSRRRSRSPTSTATASRTAASRTCSSTCSTSACRARPGAAGANTDPSLLAATLAAKLGQSPPGTIAFDYLRGAERRPVLPRPLADLPRRQDQGAGARHRRAGTTGCCAARPRCTARSRAAGASRRGCTWTRARTRAAARRSRR